MLTGTDLNVESLEILKWKEKNGTFFVCFADDSKTLVTVHVKHLKSATTRSFWVHSENGRSIGFGVTVCEILKLEILKNCRVSKK